MALDVENISELERRINISVPLKPLEAQIEARLKEIGKNAKFSGFRPGKAPIGLINQQYGDQVRDEVYSAAVEQSFGDAIEEQKLRVAGFPDIQHKPFDAASENLEYTATFEIFPEVKLADLSKVKIERPTLKVAKANVDKTLDVLVKQRATYTPVTRGAKKGDRINIALTASVDGEEVESTADKGIDLVIGEGGRVESFDKALTGAKAKVGQSKTFDVTYPDDHQPATIAGKTVTYAVTFNSVEEPALPEIDAAFAKSLGIEDGDVEKMREGIKDSLSQEVDKRIKSQTKEQVFAALVESADFTLPNVLITTEQKRLMETAQKNLEERGGDMANVTLEPAMFDDEAKRNTTLRLILSEIVNSNDLQANADQVRAMVDVFSQSFEKPDDVVKWYFADPKRLDEPAALATEENVVEWVLSQANVTDKKVKFDDLMGNN